MKGAERLREGGGVLEQPPTQRTAVTAAAVAINCSSCRMPPWSFHGYEIDGETKISSQIRFIGMKEIVTSFAGIDCP